MNIISKSIVSLGLAAVFAFSASAGDKHFQGPYVGADIGVTDGGEFYYGGLLGFRQQTDNNIVFGIEGSFGDYATSENYSGITAKIDHAWSAAGYLGYVFGESGDNLIKIGAGYNEVKASASGFGQSASDSVGDIRAFIGYERALSKKLNFRISADYLKFDDSHGAQATMGLSLQF